MYTRIPARGRSSEEMSETKTFESNSAMQRVRYIDTHCNSSMQKISLISTYNFIFFYMYMCVAVVIICKATSSIGGVPFYGQLCNSLFYMGITFLPPQVYQN